MSSLGVVVGPSGRAEVLDRYVEFVAARCRPNTVIATVSDLRVFFAVIDKEPAAVTSADGAPWRPPMPPARPKLFPPSPRDVLAFVASALVGLAIWWPTMAMQPRFDYSQQHRQGSPWFFPLMLGAAVVLGVACSRGWWVVAPGLIAAQLVVSPFTTPRGDNDGLWVLIVPMLLVIGAALAFVSRLVALTWRSVRRTGSQPRR